VNSTKALWARRCGANKAFVVLVGIDCKVQGRKALPGQAFWLYKNIYARLPGWTGILAGRNAALAGSLGAANSAYALVFLLRCSWL
jgi:hypothetical protein